MIVYTINSLYCVSDDNIYCNLSFLRVVEDAWGYIEDTREMVHDLEKRVQKAKDNVESVTKLMQTWNKLPLFERKKEGKAERMLNLDDRADRVNKRYNEIRDVGLTVHSLVKVGLRCCCQLLPWIPLLSAVIMDTPVAMDTTAV